MTDPGPSSANAFADFLEREQDRIIGLWTDCVRRIEAKTQGVSEPALVNSVPQFLRHIARALRGHAQTVDTPAREHGSQRYHLGFDLRLVVLEYNLLHKVIFEVLDESGLPVYVSDLRTVHTAFADGIAVAVDQYSHEREHDLRVSAPERERAAAFERRLIAIVSHDLRGPLATILMAADLATRSGPAACTARQIERIRRAAQRATRLIADLLDFTKVRSWGQLPIRPQKVSLRELVDEALKDTEALFPGRVLRCHLDQDVEVFWDPDRIVQLLLNLLTNAAKFSSPSSQVTLRARVVGGFVVLEVHNEGPPIAPERKATIFEPFQRSDASPPTPASLGLGLYISSQIVCAHGGTIDLTSSDEAGTTFTVRLPSHAAAPACRPSTPG